MIKYDITDIVDKLIGDTRPIGESGVDSVGRQNQIELIYLIDSLTDILCNNARYANRQEGSMSIIGKDAKVAIKELIEKLNDSLEDV